MSKNQVVYASHEETKLSLKSYTIGFILSLVLTLTAYIAVTKRIFSTDGIVAFIVALALTQFIVQLYFFLHLGHETRPRWKLAVFFFMLGVVLILVFGSLWIMNNLNYRMTIPQQEQYMNNQDGL